MSTLFNTLMPDGLAPTNPRMPPPENGSPDDHAPPTDPITCTPSPGKAFRGFPLVDLDEEVSLF